MLRLIKTFYELFTLYGAVSALAMDNYSLRVQGLNWSTIHMWLTMAHLDRSSILAVRLHTRLHHNDSAIV